MERYEKIKTLKTYFILVIPIFYLWIFMQFLIILSNPANILVSSLSLAGLIGIVLFTAFLLLNY